MKQLKFTTLFLLLGAFLFVQPAYAMIETHNATTAATIEKQKTDLKKEFKAEKKMAKLQKFFKSAGIDFQDPVNKWLWFGIFGVGASVVLQIIAGTGILSSLGYLLGVAGVVCLVIWVVKKFA